MDRLRRLLRALPDARRRQWALLVPAVALGAALEALGGVAVFVFGAVLADPGGAVDIPLLDRSLRPEGQAGTLAVVGVLVGVLVVKAGYQAGLVYVRSRISHGTMGDLTSRLFRAYLATPWLQGLRQETGTRVARMQMGVERSIRLFLEGLVGLLSEVLVVSALLAVLVAVSPLAASVAAVALALLAGALAVWFRGRVRRLGRAVEEGEERRLGVLYQGLEGLKTVRVMGLEAFFQERLEHRQAPLVRARSLLVAATELPRPLVEALFVVGLGVLVAVLLTAGAGGPGGTSAPLALLALYAYAGFRIIPSFNRILYSFSLVVAGSESVDPVVADVEGAAGDDADEALPAAPGTAVHRVREAPGDARSGAGWTSLELAGVTVRYPGQERAALRGVDLVLRPGESVGIFGSTGAGKSTLLDVVLGLLRPTEGRVLLDGEPLEGARVRRWRAGIGYVPQDTFVLTDTLLRNVAFGVPDREIDEARARTALERAQLVGLVRSLPEGLETVVGEGAVGLSGGERQRLAVARALYRRPRLLVLDEATSALDRETEARLQAALEDGAGERGLLVVTHRPSLVRSCDRVVFIVAGRAVAEGSFEELVDAEPAFRAIVRAGSGGGPAPVAPG